MEYGDDEYWENYSSGPYCSHWAEPWDCDALCTCGHECKDHDLDYDSPETNHPGTKCRIEGCTCTCFKDAPVVKR